MKFEDNTPVVIYNGSRGDDFKNTIYSVLQKGHLKTQYIGWLMSDDSLRIFNDVFTSNTANVLENYEVYEHRSGEMAVKALLSQKS